MSQFVQMVFVAVLAKAVFANGNRHNGNDDNRHACMINALPSVNLCCTVCRRNGRTDGRQVGSQLFHPECYYSVVRVVQYCNTVQCSIAVQCSINTACACH